MSRYWIADLHLGHEKVAEIRGFKSYQEHDEYILNQLSKLTTGDMLWVLGDISSGSSKGEDYALWILQNEVKAPMHLIAGNHDSVSSIHRQGYKKQREWLETFDSIQQFGRLRMGGHHVLMSHYPYARSGDGPGRGEARYNEFRLPEVGFPLIHGHTHHTEPHMTNVINQRLSDGSLRPVRETFDTSQYCVSWDVHRSLVTEADLNKWVEEL